MTKSYRQSYERFTHPVIWLSKVLLSSALAGEGAVGTMQTNQHEGPVVKQSLMVLLSDPDSNGLKFSESTGL